MAPFASDRLNSNDGDKPSRDTDGLAMRIEALEKKIALQEAVLAIISHDVRSPITSTIGLINLLLNSKAENLTERQLTILESLERSSKRQLALVEELSMISKILRGKVEMKPEKVEMKGLIDSCISELGALAGDKEITLSSVITNGALADIDKTIAIAALRHIVMNAIWFTKPGGLVELGAGMENGQAYIFVSDNGVGMTAEFMEKLFNPDDRVFTFGTGDEKGAGLGLYIARELVQLNKGKLELESSKDKGTTVKITFPAVTSDQSR